MWSTLHRRALCINVVYSTLHRRALYNLTPLVSPLLPPLFASLPHLANIRMRSLPLLEAASGGVTGAVGGPLLSNPHEVRYPTPLEDCRTLFPLVFIGFTLVFHWFYFGFPLVFHQKSQLVFHSFSRGFCGLLCGTSTCFVHPLASEKEEARPNAWPFPLPSAPRTSLHIRAPALHTR